MLPPPAGEGWGGGSKVKIMPVDSIPLRDKENADYACLEYTNSVDLQPLPGGRYGKRGAGWS